MKPQSHTSLPSPLLRFMQVSLLFTLATLVAVAISRRLHLPDPYRFTYFYQVFGSDFSLFQQRFLLFRQPGFYGPLDPPFLYPSTLAVVYHLLFAAWGNHPHPEYLIDILALIISTSALALFFRSLCRRGLAKIPAAAYCIIALATSYPLAYVIQRGNIEEIVWLTLLLAFWAFRKQHFQIAAVFIGVAIAFKFYPVILLGLFLYPRRYRAIATALATAVVATVLSDLWLGPSISIAQAESARGMAGFVQMYVTHYIVIGWDHSLFAFAKALTTKLNLVRDLKIYFLVVGITATSLYFLRIRRLPVVNQVCVLLILSIIIPPVSYDYTLLHVYTCWGIFSLYVLDLYRRGKKSPKASAVMACFAVAVAPHNYIFHRHEPCEGFIHCLGLLGLLYLFLRYPFVEECEAAFAIASTEVSI